MAYKEKILYFFPVKTPDKDIFVIPSTSFSGLSALRIISSSICFGSGRSNKQPCIELSLLIKSISFNKSLWLTSIGSVICFVLTPLKLQRFIAADYAAQKGVVSDDKQLFYFRDHVLEYMTSHSLGQFSPKDLYSAGLKRLIEHDKNNATSYVETLDKYLENEMNATRTANLLFIHRSSFLKRLKNINKIIDDKLENSDTKLHLRMCLKILKENN